KADALLHDNVQEAIRLDGELEGQRRLVRVLADQVGLLRTEADRAEAKRQGKQREALIERLARKLADADAIAVQLQDDVAQVEKRFRQVIELREQVRAAFNVSSSHARAARDAAEGCALSANAMRALLSYELFRVGAKPFLGGTPRLCGRLVCRADYV